MDWEAFLIGLTERENAVVENLLAGRNGSEIARMFGVDPSSIHQCKKRLAGKILDFMGLDILIEIRRSPKWRDNLNAERELLACKYDRRH